MMFNKIFQPLVICCLVFLTGCLEFSEIFQIKPEGSVQYTLKVSIPEMPDKDKKGKQDNKAEMEEEIQNFFSLPLGKGLTLVDKKDQVLYGLNVFSLKLEADKITDLNQFYKFIDKKTKETEDKKKNKKGKEAFDLLFSKGLFKVKKTKHGTLKFSRAFTPPKIKKKKTKKKEKEDFQKGLEEAFMNMFRFRFEVFVPSDVIQTNAEVIFKRDLRWETTLGYLFKNPFEMEFEIQATPELLKTYKK